MTLDDLGNYSDILSIPLAILGLILIIRQLNMQLAESEREHTRRQKEMTLNSYNSIRGDLRRSLKSVRNKLGLDDMFDTFTQEHLEQIFQDKKLRHEVIKMLSYMNKFAVGVKHDVFNIHLLNDLAGDVFVNTYKQFKPYIYHVRKNSSKFYRDYESLVQELIKLQKEEKY